MMTPDQKATKIISLLKKRYPDAHCELNFSNPHELLVATILSAQCTDKRVNEVTKSLFKKYKKARDYALVPLPRFEQEIRSTGFYKNKAKAIQGCCKILDEKYEGKIPKELGKLVEMPGIGRKTANLVLGHTYDIPGIVTDTHVIRVSQRLGLTKNKDPEKIEYDLQKIVPEKDWTFVSDVLIFHGRRCCYAKKPNCPECPVLKLCPYEPKTQ